MENLFSVDQLLALLNAGYAWVLANVFVLATVTQIAVVAGTLAAAALMARRARPWLERHQTHPQAGRSVQIVLPLLFSLLWLVALWIAISAAAALDNPRGVITTAATLVAAWVAIRLASQLLKNQLWAKFFAWVAWSIAALSILGWLDPTINVLQQAGMTVGDVRITLWNILKSTVALAVLLSMAIYLAGLIESRIRTSRALSPTVQVLFTKSLKIVLISLAVLIAIQNAGIDLTALAVVGGAIGLGIGFGFQKTVSNLISGVILLIDKSIKPGDVIAVSGTYGWVTTLGGRYVSVVTRDGVEHLIPNETLISERVENWTHTNSRTRLKVDVGVHYGSDLHQVISLCEQAAGEIDRVLKDPEPKCLFVAFGDSALEVQVRFWIADAQNGVQNVKSAVLLRVWEKFKLHGVEVPYPQRDVHIRSGLMLSPPAGPQ